MKLILTPVVFGFAAVALSLSAHAVDSTTVHSTKTTTSPDGSKTVEETTTTKTIAPAGDVAESEAKEDFKTKMKAQLDTLSAQIDKLKTQASTASSDAKAGLEKRADELDKKRNEINAQLDEASHKTGRAWAQFKSGVQKSVDELQTGYSKAKKEFSRKEAADKREAEAAASEKKAKK